jgi:hypothetical protein
MHLELFVVRILTPCVPFLGLWGFFSPEAPAIFLKEGYAGNVTPCRVLVVKITSFHPSVSRLESLLFDGGAGLSCSHSGEHCITVRCGRQASWHLQSSRLPLSGGAGIPFQLLDRTDRTLLQVGEGSPAVRLNGECEASMCCRRQAFWCHSLSSRLQLSFLQ